MENFCDIIQLCATYENISIYGIQFKAREQRPELLHNPLLFWCAASLPLLSQTGI